MSGDDDNETSQYLNQSVFRPEKEVSLIGIKIMLVTASAPQLV